MLELHPGALWFRGEFPPLENTTPWVVFFCVYGEDVSHDPTACKIPLVSLFLESHHRLFLAGKGGREE